MKWLITSDCHLSDKPRDKYRFGLFDWMRAKQEKLGITATFILGDLTEDKDKHSSLLVNQTMDGLMLLKPPVYIVRGNHDGVSAENPFFKFVNHIDGIRMIVTPEHVMPGLFAIPHQRSQKEFDVACQGVNPKGLRIMCHQTFDGAIAETGGALSGLSRSAIEFSGSSHKPLAIWAGDVHKPQTCGLVTYLGAPYHCRFGDKYQPRVLFVDEGVEKNLYFEAPHKWALKVNSASDIEQNSELRKNDQVKLVIRLKREDVPDWNSVKQRCLDVCKAKGVEVFGVKMEIIEGKKSKAKEIKSISPADILQSFCKSEGIDGEIKEAGLALL